MKINITQTLVKDNNGRMEVVEHTLEINEEDVQQLLEMVVAGNLETPQLREELKRRAVNQ